jgi:hypothetical protein
VDVVFGAALDLVRVDLAGDLTVHRRRPQAAEQRQHFDIRH